METAPEVRLGWEDDQGRGGGWGEGWGVGWGGVGVLRGVREYSLMPRVTSAGPVTIYSSGYS